MDNSKEYIEMCKKAESLQELWEPKPWDYICEKKHKEVFVLSGYQTDSDYYGPGIEDFDDAGESGKKAYFWLPRQDQLQEMIESSVWFEKLYRFYDWLQTKEDVHSWCNSPCTKFNSMEQLWLAFVMKEKFNKAWDGKDWRSVK